MLGRFKNQARHYHDDNKSNSLKLEQDKESLEITISKERIERPAISKDDIKWWVSQFGVMNLDDCDAVTRLIDTFLNCIYVYDDKMLVILNYKDCEFCVSLDEVNETINN